MNGPKLEDIARVADDFIDIAVSVGDASVEELLGAPFCVAFTKTCMNI
jgi:hypothetical protein